MNTLRKAVLYFHLSLKSDNAKTGKMPVSTTSKRSCPLHCPLAKNGCYAEGGKLNLHWQLVTDGERGTLLPEFCDKIRALPDGTLWRHNQAGDLPSQDRQRLDGEQVKAIVEANRGKRGFTYCHYLPSDGDNAQIIKHANDKGFTVNLSADNLAEADQFKSLGIGPVTVIVPKEQKTNFRTPAGNLVVICPYETKGVQCKRCKLCAWPEREVIVAFPVHGPSAKKAELVAIQAMA